ncbi:MAG: retropepsin-like aspartic protease family protein [Bacteroidales bacterium]
MKTINYFLITILIFLTSCSGCSRSGRIRAARERSIISNTEKSNRDYRISKDDSKSNVIKMVKENDVYQIPVEINGISMKFIFDTGASIISISNTEALFLYKQGKLADEDFIGKNEFMDANGDISVGTIINLKTIKIGNKTINNVKASVVNNLGAPLLLGQSALQRFGKISVDYSNETITFE